MVLPQVKGLIQNYKPFSNTEGIYNNKTLKKLILQFRERVIAYISFHKHEFIRLIEGNVENYLSNMRNLDAWSNKAEVKAISRVLGCKVYVSSNVDPFEVSYNGPIKIELFYDMTALGESKDGNHYTFGLEKKIGDKYTATYVC